MTDARSYHYFLGNGIDAVLLGPDGGMSPEAARGLDRCYWYKSDLYYPDHRVLDPDQDPRVFLAAPPGGTNCQLAPLARVWFQILDPSTEAVLSLLGSEQRFSSATGTLHTVAHYPGLDLTVETSLIASAPLLRFALTGDSDVLVRAHVAPGLWPADGEQSEPSSDPRHFLVEDVAGVVEWSYRVGDERLRLQLRTAGEAGTLLDAGSDASSVWLLLRGRSLGWSVALTSSRYPDEASCVSATGDTSSGLGVAPTLEIPDAEYTRMHAFSMYMFQAMQNRESGGLPVNNLRRTFNSHVFWDGAFVQRALLEAGYVGPAREAWRFLGRTREAAAANARATFDAPGLHWDWEVSHRGERAYLPWLQQRFQVHNTPLLAHMIVADYRATRDLAVLDEGFELLGGAAEFILHAVLVPDGERLVTRPLVGSHESSSMVADDGATVASCLRLLRDVALASRLLGRDRDLGARCATAAHRLLPTLRGLFNGRYLQASRDEDRMNTSSLTPIYPADTLMPTDPRAIATATAYRALYAGRMAGHGNNDLGFPWSAGILARILAYQGAYHVAWEQLALAKVALCSQGGCAEYVEATGQWNLQYFSTAQAALCSAVQALLLQTHGRELRLFPALPTLGWTHASFRDFLTMGLRVSARYENRVARVEIVNSTDRSRGVLLTLGTARAALQLGPGERVEVTLGGSHGRE